MSGPVRRRRRCRTVPLYFFDTRDDGAVIADPVGLEFPNVEAVKRQAAKSLAELARDVLPGVLRRVLAVDVRDESGDAVLTAELTFQARLLKGEPARPEPLQHFSGSYRFPTGYRMG